MKAWLIQALVKAIIKVLTKAEFLSGGSTGEGSTQIVDRINFFMAVRTHSNLILQSEHRRVGWKGWINWKTEIGIYTLLYIK